MSRKKRLFKQFLDKTIRSCLWLLPCIFSYPAFANPQGASVVAGEVRIEAQGPQLSIHQSSDRAIIDWRSFDIGQNEQTQFYQPSSSSWTLNRIGSQSASQILGNLTANGHIILVNPHGVFFGKDSVVDVGGLIASTADIQNTDFLKSQYRFNVPGKPDGLIVNQGRISFKEAGLGVLVAPSVKNQGVIKGRLGKLTLASGDVFTLDLYGDQLIRIGLQNKVKAQLIEQKGLLELPGGEVLLTSAAARDVVDSFIDISGEIKAQTVEQKNGRIIIKAEGSEQKEGRVILTGKLDANGATAKDNGGSIQVSGRYINHTADIKTDGSKGGDIIFDAKNVINQGKISAQGQSQGGNIHINYQEQYLDNSANQYCVSGQQGGFIGVTGDTGSRLYSSGQFESQGETGGHIHVLGGNLHLFDVKINASGTALGGEILVGGDYQGQGNLFKSERTTVNTSSHLKADGQAQGGKIVVWSEQETQFLGELSAAGRAPGLIEVSSHDKLGFNGRLSPTAGKQADLLLDPQNITISTAAITQFPQFNFANPSTNLPSSGYGTNVAILGNGNIVITSPNDNVAASAAGAVYLFNGSNAALISTLTGSHANDQIGSWITALTGNNNYVIQSNSWNGNIGAATWGNGSTGTTGIVSSSNSLVGSTANDQVSSSGIIALTNGNYVVGSSSWNGAIGAATWGNGSTGITGTVSLSNSLVGSTANDQVGWATTALTNGNYVVGSIYWNGTIGAATWGNGSTGTTGTVSSSNSLVGSTANDNVGSTLTALSNGNYGVASPNWNGGIGAATWGNGSTGTIGTVSSSNSLVGSTANDQVSASGITALTNGNYGVASPNWSGKIGAATWGNGSTGTTGAVSSSNSLVGSTANDQVSVSGITALTNGNYLVASANWNGAIGAATWGNGSTGTTGTVSSSNSLVGSTANDQVGYAVTALTSGNYVVASANWNGNTGAATWGSGTAGVTGTITAANSMLGASANTSLQVLGEDTVNGNFLVAFPSETGGGRVTAGPTNGVAVPYASFSSYGGYSSILAPSVITNALNGNVNISLQANNDITVNNAITATTSNSATLTLQAGRSILINANITTDNGNLVLAANDTTADGVVDMYRSAGAAAITQAAGTTLNTGTGNLSVTLKNGAGKTNVTSGNITLDTVDAQNIAIQNDGPSNGSNILMAQASSLITANSVSLNISNAANTTGTLGTSGMPIAVTTTDVNAATQGGNIYLKSPNNAINLGGAALGGLTGVSSGTGNLSVVSAGAITDSQALTIGGTSSLTTTAGNAAIHLTQASSYTGAVSLNTNGTGNATLTGATSTLNLGASTIGGNLTTSSAGAISDSGALTVAGTASFTTTAGNAAINLAQASRYTGAVYLNTHGTGNGTIQNVLGNLTLGGPSSIGGNLSIILTGDFAYTPAQLTVGGTTYIRSANINIPPILLLINQPLITLITPVLEDEIFLVAALNFNTPNNNILGLTKNLQPAASLSTDNNQFTVLDFFLHAEAVPFRYTRVNANNELSQEQEESTVHL